MVIIREWILSNERLLAKVINLLHWIGMRIRGMNKGTGKEGLKKEGVSISQTKNGHFLLDSVQHNSDVMSVPTLPTFRGSNSISGRAVDFG
jgi:hypothetical protein